MAATIQIGLTGQSDRKVEELHIDCVGDVSRRWL